MRAVKNQGKGRCAMKARRPMSSVSGKWPVDHDTAAVIAVARTLRQLLHTDPAFHLINSLLTERIDVDHLAVGPTGVFAIEARSDRDAVRLDKQGELVDGANREGLHRVRRGTAAVRDRLRRRGFDVDVQGVLCLPFGALERPHYVDGIIA